MIQTIVLVFRKAIAILMSVFMFLGLIPSDKTDSITRGKENTVTSYDVQNSDYQLSINADKQLYDISELLYGIFFEDINFAADGGLYAEMVANRSFEFGTLARDDEYFAWSNVGTSENKITVGDKVGGLNANNTNYMVVNNTSGQKAGFQNRGFMEGMAIKKGANYYFSVYAKGMDGYTGPVTVNLVSGSKVAATATIDAITENWEKYDLTLVSKLTATKNVYLQVLIENGKAAFDMVSLFPDTYKDHGMRMDLAEKLAALEPKFIRFPGGCVTEGWDEETAYHWKDSVGVDENGLPLEFNGKYGDVAARKYGINLWTDIAATDDPYPSYMSYGLGFYEFFQLAEDIGAVGVPVLNAGLYCQARGRTGVDLESELFQSYIQDMLDLVEFCRGDKTTTWGKVRADLGHEEPFELKYICIGNENWGETYFVRYSAFLKAFNEAKAANPELYDGIELIYSSGVDDGISGADYLASYEYAKQQLGDSKNAADFAGATDHHYYNEPMWFLENADYYDSDNYKRDVENMTDTIYGGALGVFLGEYAAQSNTLYAALAEAAYMTGLERNGDIVKMAAYAPLFGNNTASHWAPDLIWFNNQTSTSSVNYYMQKLFSTNQGKTLVSSSLSGAEIPATELHGKVGLGTWSTAAEFDNVKITDNETGKILGSDEFKLNDFWLKWKKLGGGSWEVKDGKLIQPSVDYPGNATSGRSVMFGDERWSNYTYTFEATKLEGAEGFFIPFLIEDNNNMFLWNIGGWGNTKSALQRVRNGGKTDAINGTVTDFKAEDGVTYEIKIVVDGRNIKGYIDGELQFDYDVQNGTNAEAYQVVSTDESGDIIIKLVNVTGSDRSFAIDLEGMENISSKAKVYQVSGYCLDDENKFGWKETCKMIQFTVDGVSENFNYTVPQYSATVIRISK